MSITIYSNWHYLLKFWQAIFKIRYLAAIWNQESQQEGHKQHSTQGKKTRKNEREKGSKDRSVGEIEKTEIFSILRWAEELHSEEMERSAGEQQ